MTTVLAFFVFGLMLLFGLGFALLIAGVAYLWWRGVYGSGEPFVATDPILHDRPQIDPDAASCGDCDGDD